jgi:O-antigen ligase
VIGNSTPVSFDDYLSLNVKNMWQGFRQESWFFWFLCLYFLFEYTRLQAIYPWLGVIPWAQMTLLLAFAGAIFSSEFKFKTITFEIVFFLFLVHILITSIFAENPSASFEKLSVMVNWAIMYYCVVVIVDSKKRFFILLSVMMLASFKMSQHAALSWAARGFAFERWGIAGPVGWFGDSADLGLQMCIFLAFAALFYFLVRRRVGIFFNVVLLAMMISALAAILATGNRGTFLGLLGMLLAFLMIQKNRFRNVLLLAAVLAALLWAAPKEFLDRFDTAGKDKTSTERLIFWENGIEMGNKYPLLGVGYENFSDYNRKRFDHKSMVAHNAPITVFAELGYPGLILYFYLIYKVVRVNFVSRKLARDKGDGFSEAMSTAIIVGTAGYFVASMFISVGYYPFLYVQMAFSAALYRIVKYG